ncbi:peroxisome biogenesis factor 10 [Cystobasidiomycetes sp. EMM_F5]
MSNGEDGGPNAGIQPTAAPSGKAGEAVTSHDQVRGNLGAGASPAQQSPTTQRRPGYTAPFFASAAQPEIIRANQKDLYYLAQLSQQLEEVLRSALGTRWLQSWASEVGIASSLLYYTLTTLVGSQTLGEEYVDILQYSSKTRKIPNTLSRLSLILSHTLAPYLLARLYTAIKQRLIARRALRDLQIASRASTGPVHVSNESEPLFADDSSPPLPEAASTTVPLQPPVSSSSSFTARLPLLSLLNNIELPAFENLINEHVRAIHLAIFYLFGRYYHLAKRFFRIRYLSLQPRPTEAQQGAAGTKPPSYEVLGVLMVVQLSVRLISHIMERRRLQKEQTSTKEKAASISPVEEAARPIANIDGRSILDLTFDPEDPHPDDLGEAPDAHSINEYEDEDEVSQARRCTLCLSPRRDPAATECGHVFCYQCIVGWAREKPECPLCRQKVILSKILPLYGL